jgi:hypothetical protein
MCDNSLIADQFRQRLNQATVGVDQALESVRAMREAILGQMAQQGGAYLDEFKPERYDEVTELIGAPSAAKPYSDDEIYLTQSDYVQLMRAKSKVDRLLKVHGAHKTSLGIVCAECRDSYGSLVTWPCDTARILA